MADTQFPSYMDLEKISQMNPGVAVPTYQQYQSQNDLANMFAQSNIQQEGENLKQKQLANIFAEQNNPQLVEQQRLVNEGKGFANTKEGVAARISAGTEQEQYKSAIAKHAQEISDSDLKQGENAIQQMMFSTDPAVRAKGAQMYSMHRDLVKEREKLALQNQGQLAVAGAQGANQLALENQQFEHGKYNKGKAAVTLNIALAGAKTFAHRANILDSAAYEAEANNDTASAKKFSDMAAQARQDDINARAAGAATQRPGQVDTAALTGIPTLEATVPTARGATPPAANAPAGLPPGTQDLGNGVFQLPDGRKIRKTK